MIWHARGKKMTPRVRKKIKKRQKKKRIKMGSNFFGFFMFIKKKKKKDKKENLFPSLFSHFLSGRVFTKKSKMLNNTKKMRYPLLINMYLPSSYSHPHVQFDSHHFLSSFYVHRG